MSYSKIVELKDADLLGDVENQNNIAADIEQDIEDEFQLPSKFKDKTKEEIAKSYLELEQVVGRQGNELGQYRKHVDSLIQRDLERSSTSKKEVIEDNHIEVDELLENPSATIRKEIHKELESVRNELKQTRHTLDFNSFVTKHPDYIQIANDPNFLEWVNHNPRRVRKYEAANYQSDLESADELLSDWNEISAMRASKKDEQAEKRKEALKKGAVEKGTSSEGKTGRKTYRRSDLLKMRQLEPEKFDRLQAEIIKAYKEGRVVDG